MDSTVKIVFIWHCICSLVICDSGNIDTNSFQITRGKHDTFKNLKCMSTLNSNGTNSSTNQCEEYQAECVDNNCCRCRCYKSGAGTFIVSGPRSGKCTKNEDVIQQSVPEKSFRLMNKAHKRCLSVLNNKIDTIVGENCSSSLNMHWIWIKDTNGKALRLMNVETLQCLESRIRQCQSQTGSVTIKQCNKTEGQKIHTNRGKFIQFKFCKRRRFFYLTLSKTSKNNVLYSAKIVKTHVNLEWNNAEKHKLNWHSVTYEGCYRFQDKSFMLYLDNDSCCKTTCSHEFFAPIFAGNKKCIVEWMKSEILYNDMLWQDLQERDIKRKLAFIERSTSANMKVLKIKWDALRTFNGSLLRLAISCSNENKSKSENHCLLLKFKSLTKPVFSIKAMNTKAISTPLPTPTPSTPNYVSQISSKKPEQSKNSISSTTKKPEVKLSEKLHSSGTNSVTISVTVTVTLLLIVLALTLGYLVYYRRRNRIQVQQNSYDGPSYKESLNNETLSRDESLDLKENHDYESLGEKNFTVVS